MMRPADRHGCLKETVVLHAVNQAPSNQHHAVPLGFGSVSGSISNRSIKGPMGG